MLLLLWIRIAAMALFVGVVRLLRRDIVVLVLKSYVWLARSNGQ